MWPPMVSLKLECHEGYTQVISLEASGDSQGNGVTIQAVLRTRHKDLALRMPSPRSVLSKLGAEERAGINAAFEEKVKSKEELSKDPRSIDGLGSKNKFQILPERLPDGSILLPTSTFPTPRGIFVS